MKNNKYILIFLLLIVLSFQVLGFNNLFTWGNGGYDNQACKGYLFSSCFPQSDQTGNFSLLTISDSSKYAPVVYRNLRDELNNAPTDKFLYVTNANSVGIYNLYDGSLYTTYQNTIHTTSFIGSTSFSRFDFDNANGYMLVNVETDDNTANTTYITFSVMDTTTKAIATWRQRTITGSVPYSYSTISPTSATNYISLYLVNGSIETYTYDSEYNITKVSSIYFETPTTTANTYAYYSTPIIMQDMNNDGNDDILAVSSHNNDSGGQRYFYIDYLVYDVHNKNYITSITHKELFNDINALLFPPVYNRISIQPVKTGLSSGQYKVYISNDFNYVRSIPNVYNKIYNFIYDINGNLIFEDKNYYTVTTNETQSNMVFTDFNLDGLIETCVYYNGTKGGTGVFNTFSCYNGGLNLIFEINTTISNSKIIAMQKIYNNTLYMSVITNKDIQNFDFLNINNVYNLSYNKYGYQIPVNTIDKVNYSNDFIAVYNTFIDIYQLKQTSDSCGNNICSVYETPLTCPQDCTFNDNNVFVNTSKKNPTVSCTIDSECLSNKCTDYRCSYLSVNQACSIDGQCLSGACTNNKCEQSSLSQNLNQAKNELFGYDSMTANIIALIITFVMSIVVLVVIAILTQHGAVAGIGGVLTFIGCLVFFTMFGWLSAWILFSVLVLVIALIMGAIFLKASGG